MPDTALLPALDLSPSRLPARLPDGGHHHIGHIEGDDDTVLIRIGGGTLLLRTVIVPRYKESELSGDEWRTSVSWEVRTPGAPWAKTSRTFHDAHTAYAAAYSLFESLLPGSMEAPVDDLSFDYKGQTYAVWPRRSEDAAQSGYTLARMPSGAPLRDALGRLPWLAMIAREQADMDLLMRPEAARKVFCCHPGCRALPEVMMTRADQPRTYYRFCHLHRTRGDASLTDADDKYSVATEADNPVEDVYGTAPKAGDHMVWYEGTTLMPERREGTVSSASWDEGRLFVEDHTTSHDRAELAHVLGCHGYVRSEASPTLSGG